jgi:hypothetical protein
MIDVKQRQRQVWWPATIEPLARELYEVVAAFNEVDDGTLVARSEYLEVVATKT